MKPLFEMPELLTLGGISFTGGGGPEEGEGIGDACALGCESGCYSGCKQGEGVNPKK